MSACGWMSLVKHVLQLFVSPASAHRHSTAAVKNPSRLKVMEAWFCFISPAERCWLELFFFRGEEKRKTTPLQLMNAFGDRKITTDIERQITCFYCAHVWMKNRCLSSLSFIIVCGHSNMAAKQSTLLKSLLSAKPCSWHPSTIGYQSKCITMNILGVMLEFTGTWVGSKCNVLLC